MAKAPAGFLEALGGPGKTPWGPLDLGNVLGGLRESKTLNMLSACNPKTPPSP